MKQLRENSFVSMVGAVLGSLFAVAPICNVVIPLNEQQSRFLQTGNLVIIPVVVAIGLVVLLQPIKTTRLAQRTRDTW